MTWAFSSAAYLFYAKTEFFNQLDDGAQVQLDVKNVSHETSDRLVVAGFAGGVQPQKHAIHELFLLARQCRASATRLIELRQRTVGAATYMFVKIDRHSCKCF